MKDRKLKDREEKIQIEIEELFFKLITVSNMDKFEEKEMKEKKTIKNTWYNWLINYISEPIRKNIGGFKDKVVSLFKMNISKQTVYERGKKLSKPKTQKQSEENIIKTSQIFLN